MAQQPKARRDDNIKILSVVWFKVLPPKFGGQKAVAFFNRYFAEQAALICLCSKNNAAADSGYKILPLLPTSKWQFINPFTWRTIYLAARKNDSSHLLIEFPYHGISGIICRKLLHTKLIVNTHNIEYLRFKQQRKWWWKLLYYFECLALRNADFVFFKTESDQALALEKFSLQPSKTAVIPYGAETVDDHLAKEKARAVIRSRHRVHEEEKILLFAGTLDYAPNANAIKNIKEHLIPLLNKENYRYRIIVCGRNKLQEFKWLNQIEDPNLIMAGEVEDIGLYFCAAHVFINPVINGGGVQTKLMDALSHHLNVVCFESKTAGILHAGNKIFPIAHNNWKGFATAAIAASESNGNTPAAFFETYNWRSIAAKAYEKICSA